MESIKTDCSTTNVLYVKVVGLKGYINVRRRNYYFSLVMMMTMLTFNKILKLYVLKPIAYVGFEPICVMCIHSAQPIEVIFLSNITATRYI